MYLINHFSVNIVNELPAFSDDCRYLVLLAKIQNKVDKTEEALLSLQRVSGSRFSDWFFVLCLDICIKRLPCFFYIIYYIPRKRWVNTFALILLMEVIMVMIVEKPHEVLLFVPRPGTYRPRCWSGCNWSSLTPSPRRSSLLPRSALRSLNTTQVRGAMRERSNSTKKLLCIVRLIARSVQLNQNALCTRCSCGWQALASFRISFLHL